MMGIIGQKIQTLEWKSNTGSNTRRQSTNDIMTNIKEKQRRPSEEALFSSGYKVFIILTVGLARSKLYIIKLFNIFINIR